MLDKIFPFFETILNFLVMTINGMVNLLLLIPKAFAMTTYSIGFIPSELRAFAICAIAISVVFLILGR